MADCTTHAHAAPAAALAHEVRTLTTTFYVYATSEDRVREVAHGLGIEVAIDRVSWQQVAGSPDGGYDHHGCPQYSKAQREWAQREAEAYRSVSMVAPASEERVVAMAEKVDGLPVFYDFDGARYWDTSRMDDMDFTRCDICGVHHHRVKVYVVARTDGSQYHAGGTCASYRDLGKKASAMLRGFARLQRELARGDEDWFDGFGPGCRAPQRYEVHIALALAAHYAERHGWVSAREAWDTGQVSTKERMAGTLEDLRSSSFRVRDAAAADIAEALHSTDATTLIRTADAFLASKEDSAFIRTCKVAVLTGAVKLSGHLAWVGHASRAWQRAQERAAREAASKVETAPYEPESVEDKLPLAVESGRFEPAASKAVRTGKITKALSGKLERWCPGEWVVTRSRSFETDFGLLTIMSLQRADGAMISWKTSSPVASDGTEIEEGDTLTLDSVSIGDVPEPRTYKGRTYQDGRRISRAKVTVVKAAADAAA